MKVCFLVDSMDISRRGGVLKVISDLSSYFSNYCGLEVIIVSLGCVKSLAFPIADKVELISLDINKFATTHYSGVKKILWFKEAYKEINKILEKNKDAIWITSSPPLSLLLSIFKINYGKQLKVMGCDHISTLYGKNTFVQNVRNFLLKKLDIMVALTPSDRDFYLSKNIKSVYIPNSIDFNNIKKEKNLRKYIVFVGRFHEVKQPLKAMELFLNSGIHEHGFRMKMFGQGKLHQEMLSFIKNNDCHDYFEIITNESNQDNIFKDAYALLMTSKVEGLPMVLLEAIARNIPCLSFDCPYGPATIINNGINGYLIEDDINDFKDKFYKLENINFDEVSRSISEFSIENVTDRWISIFNDLKNK